jgi:hypothetical protein
MDYHRGHRSRPCPPSYVSPLGCTSNSPTRHLSLLTLWRSFAPERNPSPSFSIPCALFVCLPGMAPVAFSKLSLATSHSSLATISIRINTCGRSPRFNRNQPKLSASNSLGINTYKIHLCNPFRIRTYENPRGAALQRSRDTNGVCFCRYGVWRGPAGRPGRGGRGIGRGRRRPGFAWCCECRLGDRR